MPRSLLLFIMSPGTGSYINAAAHAVENFDVENIVLINVIGSQSGEQVDFTYFTKTILPQTITGLTNGIYMDFRSSIKAPKESLEPEAKNCQAYQKLNSVLNNSYHLEKVNYGFLRDDLKKLKIKYENDVIVDISGASKRVAIDILTACLALGISKVTLFELKIISKGFETTLYHKLSSTDFQHVILPDWKPLVGNIEFFSAQQNRKKLMGVVASIIASIVLIIVQQIVQQKLGANNLLNWLFVAAIAIIGLVGGVTPIIEAWGGINSLNKKNR
jgi:hypothetical protein